MKWFLAVMFLSLFVWAQDAAQPASQDKAQAVVQVLKEADSKIPAALPNWLLIISPFLVSEVGMRLIPTAKPKSWFLALAAGLSIIGSIFVKISGLIDSFAQNLKND